MIALFDSAPLMNFNYLNKAIVKKLDNLLDFCVAIQNLKKKFAVLKD